MGERLAYDDPCEIQEFLPFKQTSHIDLANRLVQVIISLALYKHTEMGEPTTDGRLSASVGGGDSIEFGEE